MHVCVCVDAASAVRKLGRFNFLKCSERSIYSHSNLKAKGECSLSCQFNVFIAFSENLKEMRGKEPPADWANLVMPLGASTGYFTQRAMTAAPARSQ